VSLLPKNSLGPWHNTLRPLRQTVNRNNDSIPHHLRPNAPIVHWVAGMFDPRPHRRLLNSGRVRFSRKNVSHRPAYSAGVVAGGETGKFPN
jgi:hypothetical protein